MDIREKLIEILREPIFPHEMVDPIEAVADYLLDSGVTVHEWISVTERLPNVDTNKSGYERKGVIVCVDGCSKKSVYRVYERACNRGKTVYRWKYPWDTISNENITHWCEMPEPPKGE